MSGRRTKKQQQKPVRIKWSSFEIEGLKGVVATFIIGLIVGFGAALTVVYKYHQPDFVVNPLEVNP